MRSYQNKIITAGNHIRHIHSSSPIFYDFESGKRNYDKSLDGDKTDYSMRRTQDDLVLTIDSNANHWSKFLTLTFAETVLDREIALNRFDDFKKYFFRIFGENLKYIGVMERQKRRGMKENNKGSWHFHLVVFNNQKLDFDDLKKSWILGSVDIKKIDDPKNLGRYLGKYLSKANENGLNKKSVLKSRGLNKPTISYDDLPNDMTASYRTQYSHLFESTGEIVDYTITDYYISK